MSFSIKSTLTFVATFTSLIASGSASAIPSYAPAPAPTPNAYAPYNAPLSNGTASLKGHDGKTLRAITIGRGTQNYTCESSTAQHKPKAIGAVATLLNVGSMASFVSVEEGDKLLEQLPAIVFEIERSLLDHSDSIPKSGHHYFNAGGSPVFDLSQSRSGVLVGKKSDEINAPKGSVQGEFGAIPWLGLDAVSGSHDLTKGYRTVTAGGKPPATCKDQKSTIEIPYAAQYFFYQ